MHENTAPTLTELFSRDAIGKKTSKFNTKFCDEVIPYWEHIEPLAQS